MMVANVAGVIMDTTMTEHEIGYDGCKYYCYLKEVRGKKSSYFRVFCRNTDRKCKVGVHLPAVISKVTVLLTDIPPPPISIDRARARKLRVLADGMAIQIEAKLHPPVAQQRITERRAGITARLWEQGEHLQQIQGKLYAMADAIDQGTLPPILKLVKSKSDLDKLLYKAKAEREWKQPIRLPQKPEDMRPFLVMGLTSDAKLKEAVEALESLGKPTITPEQQRGKMIKHMERELVGRRIPGYFPTPTKIAQSMVDMAEILPGMDVLEPSAGKGNIADVIRQAQDVNIDVIEWNDSLQKILDAKGYNIVGADFLKHGKMYDRIIMNPPFENFQDVDHVEHAYSLLRPGGRLVSIMGEGTFFRSDKKPTRFREWLESIGGESQKLPEGAFFSSERPTGVAARIVVINKALLQGLRGYFKRRYPYSFPNSQLQNACREGG